MQFAYDASQRHPVTFPSSSQQAGEGVLAPSVQADPAELGFRCGSSEPQAADGLRPVPVRWHDPDAHGAARRQGVGSGAQVQEGLQRDKGCL